MKVEYYISTNLAFISFSEKYIKCKMFILRCLFLIQSTITVKKLYTIQCIFCKNLYLSDNKSESRMGAGGGC